VTSRWSLILFAGLFAGCGGSNPSNPEAGHSRPVDEATEKGVLIRGNGASEPESLDPHLATSVGAGKLLINLFEGLTRLHPETLAPEPAMAESWEVSPDGLTLTFRLRDAVWSDGKPVTAGDFAFAFRRLLNPELAASYASMLYPIKNAEAVSKGRMTSDKLGVTVVDDRTLQLELESPSPHLLALLAHWTAFPLPEHVVTAHGSVTDRDSKWARPETFVGNGAFLLHEWILEDVIRIRRNPSYWQAESVQLEGADYRHLESGAEERAFRAGELHLTYTLPQNRVEHYRQQTAATLRLDTYLESIAYICNTRKAPLKDVRVRKALSLSLDRATLTDKILGGLGTPAFHYVPPGIGSYTSPKVVKEDVELAQRLLAEAGFPGGEGFPELELILFSGEETEKVAAVLQQVWLQNLGIRISIVNMEKRSYFAKRREGDFDLCFLGWVGDYVDPLTFLGLWETGASNNLAGWSNPDYDRLLKDAPDALTREDALKQAETLLLEDQVMIPLYFGTTQYLKDPRVQNWHSNLLDQHPLRVVSFAEETE